MDFKIHYWDAIRDRLHEESGLHYPRNTIGKLFNIFFDETLNQFTEDDRLFLDQGFLITSSGIYLDIRGKELGLPRKEGTYAKGTVEFTLTKKIPQSSVPQPLQNVNENGTVFDYRPSDVQTIINRINQERISNSLTNTILEVREATAPFTIPEGTSVFSDTGFEYVLMDNVEFEVGQKIAYGDVIAKESGQRYNTLIDTIHLFHNDSSVFEGEGAVSELTNQTSKPDGYSVKQGFPDNNEKEFEIIVKNDSPVYITSNSKLYLKPLYTRTGVKNTLSTGESVVVALFKKTVVDGGEIIKLPVVSVEEGNTTIEYLDYSNDNAYKFIIYIENDVGSDVNADLVVTNTEAITGGVDGEEDDDYRLRLLNNISQNITINYLKRQGIIIYSVDSLEDNVRTKVTSFNPYVNNEYAIIPSNNEVRDFVKDELVTEYCFNIYIRGW